MVDVHTVGAGGGSIGWRDRGGALRVGPHSAGAEPGPACYGRGGTEPTVTDANLLLGNLAGDSRLAGGVELDAEAAAAAVRGLADSLGLGELETAEGMVRIANQEMVRALRVVTVERGLDPRRFALLPFGGAGPMHAAAIAAELGIERILCPRAGGVLSALGLCASDRRLPRLAVDLDLLRELQDALPEQMCEQIRARLTRRSKRVFVSGRRDPKRKLGLYRTRMNHHFDVITCTASEPNFFTTPQPAHGFDLPQHQLFAIGIVFRREHEIICVPARRERDSGATA